MKKNLCSLILLALAITMYSQPTQLQNPCFTNWTSYTNPDYWATPCLSTLSGYYYPCSMAQQDCYQATCGAGNCSVLLTSDTVYVEYDPYGAQEYGGTVSANTSLDGTGSSNIPLNALPDSFSFDYLNIPVGTNNEAYQYATISDPNGNEIAQVAADLDYLPTGSWQHFSAPFIYSRKTTNCTISVSFSSGTYTDTHMGSQVWIDNVNLVYNTPCPPTGVQVTPTSVNCESYNSGSINVSWSSPGFTDIAVEYWYAGSQPVYPDQYFPTSNSYTINSLGIATYVVAVIDTQNYCEVLETVAVTQPNAVTFTATHTNLICYDGYDGSITVNASGGNNYTYSDNDGSSYQASNVFNGLAANTYTLIVQDGNGCLSNPGNVSLTQPPTFTISPSSTPPASNIDNNGTASVSASGGTPPYSYNWSNGQTTADISGLATGNYSVTVTDNNGCTNVGSVNVGSPTPTVSTNSPTNIQLTSAQLNGSVDANGTIDSAFFDWGLTNSLGTTDPATPYLITGNSLTGVSVSLYGLLANNTYYYRIMASTMGSSYYGNILQFTTGATGIPVLGIEDARIYPNPAKHQFTIETNSGENYTLSMYNMMGEKVTERITSQPVTTVDISTFADGIYVVSLKKDEAVKSYRLVIMNE